MPPRLWPEREPVPSRSAQAAGRREKEAVPSWRAFPVACVAVTPPPHDSAGQVRRVTRRTYLVIALLILSALPFDRLTAGSFSWTPVAIRGLWAGLMVALAFAVGGGQLSRGRAAALGVPAAIVGITLLTVLTGGEHSYVFATLVLCPLIAFALSPDSRLLVFATLGLSLFARVGLQLYAGADGAELGISFLVFAGVGAVCWRMLDSVGALRRAGREADQARIGALERLAQSERDRHAAERRQSQEERLKLLGGLAAGVAHEVNNPLAALNANLSTLKAEAQDLVAGQKALRAAAAPVLADPNASPAAQALAKLASAREQDLEQLEDMIAMAAEMSESAGRIGELSRALAQLAAGRPDAPMTSLELGSALRSWFPDEQPAADLRPLKLSVAGRVLNAFCRSADLGEGLRVLVGFLRKQRGAEPVELTLLEAETGPQLEVVDPSFKIPVGTDVPLFAPRLEVDAPSQRMKLELALVLAHAYLTRAGGLATLRVRDGGACVHLELDRPPAVADAVADRAV